MSEPSRARLGEILARHFAFASIDWGQELGGLSSQNTAFSADGEAFVLKRYGPNARQQLARLESLATCFEQNNFPAPLPLCSSSGQRHVLIDSAAYGVFRRISGQVLHRESLGPAEMESTAELLGVLHRLGKVAKPWLGLPPKFAKPRGDVAVFSACALDECTERSWRELVAESIHYKAEVHRRTSFDELAEWQPCNHLVHGDFHNENILYGDNHHPTCILDFEASFFGHGACDVVNFIQFACCNSGFSDSNLVLGSQFVRAYATANGLMAKDLKLAWLFFFARMASSFWLEKQLLQNNAFFVSLLQRDIAKMKDFLAKSPEILSALSQ